MALSHEPTTLSLKDHSISYVVKLAHTHITMGVGGGRRGRMEWNEGGEGEVVEGYQEMNVEQGGRGQEEGEEGEE